MLGCYQIQLFGFCTKCLKIKLAEEFYVDHQKRKLGSWCIVCVKKNRGNYDSVTVNGVKYYRKKSEQEQKEKGKVG